ncbi:hypothetical protein HID58_029122 [Brassica napus]|uniref:Uncharacterized protein n=1 Tax=Brassica napus TaxID=3708 RepID=A0ABQ8CEB7_BRANA|nr:hypothetical protein HID58_029122 [Brassica napus]
MVSWSGRPELAIWRACRDRPSSPYGMLVGTDRARHMACWSGYAKFAIWRAGWNSLSFAFFGWFRTVGKRW